MYSQSKIPFSYRLLFVLDVLTKAISKAAMTVIGLLVFPLAYHFREEGAANRFGEAGRIRREKYRNRGASPVWLFCTAPRWLWPWGNDEDGYYGDDKHSAK
jgi:hypothetical protein